MSVTVLLLTTLLLPLEQDPTGNWKMTIKVGHLGEGLRTVILEISEEDEGYKGQLTSMQNRMTDADEVTFDGEMLTIWYGSYEYKLKVDGDTASGSVISPAGTQEVTANRQTSQLFAGPPSLTKRRGAARSKNKRTTTPSSPGATRSTSSMPTRSKSSYRASSTRMPPSPACGASTKSRFSRSSRGSVDAVSSRCAFHPSSPSLWLSSTAR